MKTTKLLMFLCFSVFLLGGSSFASEKAEAPQLFCNGYNQNGDGLDVEILIKDSKYYAYVRMMKNFELSEPDIIELNEPEVSEESAFYSDINEEESRFWLRFFFPAKESPTRTGHSRTLYLHPDNPFNFEVGLGCSF